jgi:opacity protein-like surface antigen
MKTLATGLAVSLATLLAASAAQAADPIMVVDTPAIEMATSNWDGPYAGIGVILETAITAPAETIIGAQGIIGINFTSGTLLFGAEAYLSGYNSSVNGLGGVVGGEVRAGLLASDAVLIYIAGGAEIDDAAATYGTAGGGVEFLVSDDLSIDIEYKYIMGINNAWRGHHAGVSANWHF